LEDTTLPQSVRGTGAAALVFVLLGGPAVCAQEAPGRYTMLPLNEDRFVRLDTITGVTSICRPEDQDLMCVSATDDQHVLRDKIARLEAENKHLKNEMRLMEETLGLTPPSADGPPMSPDTGPPAPKSQIPSEKDVDRLFDYIEGMVRKFKERVERLDKPPTSPDSSVPEDEDPSDPGPPAQGQGTPL
jgi:hypothetical protein